MKFLFIIFFLECLYLIYSFRKKKKSITTHNIKTGSNELIANIHFILTNKYDIAAFFLFSNTSPPLPYVCIGLSYKLIFLFSHCVFPTKTNITELINNKKLNFWCYKLIKEKNIFILKLIHKNPCFILDPLEINHIMDLGHCYAFKCKCILINNTTFEEIFNDNMIGTFNKCSYRNDIFYLPINKENIIIDS